MSRYLTPYLAAPALAAALMLGGPASAHPAPTAVKAADHPPNISRRDAEEQKWIDDPHIHEFYQLSIAAFANGPDKVDVDGYEQKSFALFRAMAVSWHANPDAMQDHLKLIPRQVVQIAREDPKALATYENFTNALLGPP